MKHLYKCHENILPNLIHKKMTKGKKKKNPSKGYYKAIDIIHVNN